MNTTMTRERPISFSPEMVRAILDGRKTQTRRVIKPQPLYPDYEIESGVYAPVIVRDGREEEGDEIFGAYSTDGNWGVKCPYGKPGDRLWVKESHGFVGYVDGYNHPSEADFVRACVDESGATQHLIYRATRRDWLWDAESGGRWRPSIHMPRWASRITLEIQSLRVERVQDITDGDVIAEGVRVPCTAEGRPLVDLSSRFSPADYIRDFGLVRDHYAALWDSINHKAYPWASNPWVWVLGFKVLEAPQ